MGILNIPLELLLLVAENLSLEDLSSFRSTCYQVWHILTPRFKKLCLQDVGNLTALHWAAVRNHTELIELAISNGADIDAPLRGNMKMRALSAADWLDRRYASYSWLLANDRADTEAKHHMIRTPLFLAACCGRVKAIEILLKRGARMLYVDEVQTPAHISAKKGDVDCMRAFIRAGFDKNARGPKDRTILHDAIDGGAEMVKYILQLEGGVNLVNTRTRDGSTPLHCVFAKGDRDQARLRVELLVQHGADIHARDNRGETPADLFAQWGKVGCLRILIAAGYDFNTRGIAGRTILHVAVRGGTELMAYLLGVEGARMIIDVRDDNQLTPLDLALHWRRTEVVQLLLLHGATRRKKTSARSGRKRGRK